MSSLGIFPMPKITGKVIPKKKHFTWEMYILFELENEDDMIINPFENITFLKAEDAEIDLNSQAKVIHTIINKILMDESAIMYIDEIKKEISKIMGVIL